MRIRPVLLLATLGPLGALVAYAGDYYKWTDAQGTVHYSQTAPQGTTAKTVLVTDGSPAAPPPGLTGKALTPQEKARVRANATVLTRTNAQAVDVNCTTAQGNVKTLRTRKIVASVENNPDVRAMTPGQREQALSDARAQIKTYCRKKP